MFQILKSMVKNMENKERYSINYIKTKIIDIYISKVVGAVYKNHQTKLRLGLKQEIIQMMQDQAEMQEDVKINTFEGMKVNFFFLSEVRIAAIALVVMLGLTYLVYYTNFSKNIQFQNKENLIVNQQTPTPKSTIAPIVKIRPNPTGTPIESINPDIVKSPENKGNNLKHRKSIGNATSKIVKNEAKHPNRNKIDKEQLDNQITHNNSKNDDVLPIEHISKNIDRGIAIKDPSLLSIESFYLGVDFGKTREDKELREYLDLKFKTTDLKLLSSSESFIESEYGEITKRGYFIEIHNNRTKKLLWQMPLQKTLISPKEQADKIVQKLIDDINTKKK